MTTNSTFHKNFAGAVAGGVLGLVLGMSAASCGPAATGARSSGDDLTAPAPPDDWGTDWDRTVDRRATSGDTVWTVVLATFPSETGSMAAADRMVSQLGELAPELTDLWVHSTGGGAVVASGHYDSADDPDAQANLRRVKGTLIREQPAFARAMLTRIRLRPITAAIDPYSLMSVRLRYPNRNPLYTLEVGIWSDFESGELSLDEIHFEAEAQTRRLRSQGFEAYFYHDDDKRVSAVTVGVFDHTAIDSRSGLYSPALQQLLEQFPAHLVNGEQLLEPIDGRNTRRGTRVQKPMPVLIPKR